MSGALWDTVTSVKTQTKYLLKTFEKRFYCGHMSWKLTSSKQGALFTHIKHRNLALLKGAAVLSMLKLDSLLV